MIGIGNHGYNYHWSRESVLLMEADEYYVYLDISKPPEDDTTKGIRGREVKKDVDERLPRPITKREDGRGLFKEVKKEINKEK
jgi:hypothetical protein